MANYGAQVKQFDPVSYDVWPASVMIGRSIAGIYAGDIVIADKIAGRYFRSREKSWVWQGKRWVRLCFTLRHLRRGSAVVALIEPYISYQVNGLITGYYDPGFHLSSVAGAAGEYDLPDLAAGLAPRPLLISGAVEANGRWDDTNEAKNELSFIREIYRTHGAEENLEVYPLKHDISRWLGD
jgi:hypothetical protein